MKLLFSIFGEVGVNKNLYSVCLECLENLIFNLKSFEAIAIVKQLCSGVSTKYAQNFFIAFAEFVRISERKIRVVYKLQRREINQQDT